MIVDKSQGRFAEGFCHGFVRDNTRASGEQITARTRGAFRRGHRGASNPPGRGRGRHPVQTGGLLTPRSPAASHHTGTGGRQRAPSACASSAPPGPRNVLQEWRLSQPEGEIPPARLCGGTLPDDVRRGRQPPRFLAAPVAASAIRKNRTSTRRKMSHLTPCSQPLTTPRRRTSLVVADVDCESLQGVGVRRIFGEVL